MPSNFRTDITAFIDQNLSANARSTALATLAISQRDALIQSGDASKSYTTYVDGRVENDEFKVRGTGGGIISYHFSSIGDATKFALDFLRTRVPRTTGKLSESFWVSINDIYNPPGSLINYKAIPSDATVVIGNIASYWRKADTNFRGTRTLHYRTPNELIDCVRALNAFFGRTAVKAKRLADYNFPQRYIPRHRINFQSPAIMIQESR
jgi:hypothetical protein